MSKLLTILLSKKGLLTPRKHSHWFESVATRVAVAGAATSAVTGCAGTQPPETGGFTTNTVSVAISTEDGLIASPTSPLLGANNTTVSETDWFAELQLGPSVAGQLRAAEDRAVVDCMAAKGFQVSAAPTSEYVRAMEASYAEDWREYPLELSITFEKFIATPPEPSMPQIMGADSDAAYRAMVGSNNFDIEVDSIGGGPLQLSSDSCITEARRQVYGDLKYAFAESAAANIRSNIASLAGTTEPFLSSFEQWKSCMKDAGYEFEHFNQANKAALTADDPNSLYKTILLCTERTHLTQTYRQTFNLVADKEFEDPQNEWQELDKHIEGLIRQIGDK